MLNAYYNIEYVVFRMYLEYVKPIFSVAVYRPPSEDFEAAINEIDNVVCNLSNVNNIKVDILLGINVNILKKRDAKIEIQEIS